MRVCQLCAGPMPKIVRDDALYCSTSCKLKAQRLRKKTALTTSSESVSSTESNPSTADVTSAASVSSTPASTTQKAELVAPDLTPARPFEPVLPFKHTEQLAFPFVPKSIVAQVVQIRTEPSPAPVPVENPGAHHLAQASAPAVSRVAIPPADAPRAAPEALERTKPVTVPPTISPTVTATQAAPRPSLSGLPVASPRPAPIAVAPSVPTMSSPTVTVPPTTPTQAAQSIGECVKMIIQHVQDTERKAAERRAKETPEERQW